MDNSFKSNKTEMLAQMMQNDKGESAKELTKEIKRMKNEWLIKSGLTEQSLLKFRTVDKAKIIEEEREDFLGIGFSYVENNERKMLGAPLIAYDKDNLGSFYEDSFLLMTAIANILDKENKTNPIDGSFTENHFTRVVIRFFEKKINI